MVFSANASSPKRPKRNQEEEGLGAPNFFCCSRSLEEIYRRYAGRNKAHRQTERGRVEFMVDAANAGARDPASSVLGPRCWKERRYRTWTWLYSAYSALILHIDKDTTMAKKIPSD